MENKKEFSIKASSLGFWWFMLLGLGSLLLGLIIGDYFFPRLQFTRFLFALGLMQIILLISVYYTSYRLRIVFTLDNLIIYKNSRMLFEVPIYYLEKFRAGDFESNQNMGLGVIHIHLKNNRQFKFSIKISSKEKNIEEAMKIKALLSYCVKELNFIKEPHYTKLGKSKYMFMYINSNY